MLSVDAANWDKPRELVGEIMPSLLPTFAQVSTPEGALAGWIKAVQRDHCDMASPIRKKEFPDPLEPKTLFPNIS